MKAVLLLLAFGFFATVLSEQFFGPVTSSAQLVAEQEIQRRWADIVIGLQQAHGFNEMATSRLRVSYANVAKNQGESYLELEEKEEFFPGYGAGFGGSGVGFGGQGNYQHPQSSVADIVHLEKQSTAGKIRALKYFFLQLMSTQSDVQMSYWMNKAFATVLPQQFAVFKLYKNYLSTFAVSSAIQLHDSYSLEAYLESFNQNFGFAGLSAQLSEAVAEQNVYQAWQSLVTMRLYLFYMSMYENSMMAQVVPATGFPTATNTSYLEVDEELDSQPSQQNQQSSMLAQYSYMYYFARILKYYCLFFEMSIPQRGFQMASFKTHGYKLLTDDTTSNDEDGHKWVQHGQKMDDSVVSQAIAQWSNIVQTRYYMEYYLFMFDMYLPAMATQRIMARIDSAMLNTNLLQTGPAQTVEAKAN